MDFSSPPHEARDQRPVLDVEQPRQQRVVRRPRRDLGHAVQQQLHQLMLAALFGRGVWRGAGAEPNGVLELSLEVVRLRGGGS